MGSRVKSATLPSLLLVLLLLHAGCISFGPPPPPATPTVTPKTTTASSIQDITSSKVARVSLEDAVNSLPAAEMEGGFHVTGMTITKIWGYGVDSGGLAGTWVLGMVGGGKTALIEYSEGEYRELDLPTTLPQEEVRIRELISPQELFRRNINPIVMAMNRLRVGETDLTLEEGTYQVIIHSATDSTTLYFDGKTGGLLSSP